MAPSPSRLPGGPHCRPHRRTHHSFLPEHRERRVLFINQSNASGASGVGGGGDHHGVRFHLVGRDGGGPGRAPVRWIETRRLRGCIMRRELVARNITHGRTFACRWCEVRNVSKQNKGRGADGDRASAVLRLPRPIRPIDFRMLHPEGGKRPCLTHVRTLRPHSFAIASRLTPSLLPPRSLL